SSVMPSAWTATQSLALDDCHSKTGIHSRHSTKDGKDMTEAYVYDAIRTPRGRGKDTGSLHSVKPVSLVVGLLDEVRKRNVGLDPLNVEDVILGCVSPIGEQGADIARTAALAAGYEKSGP